jgi:carbon monoxide dehydrogenase subunit G
MKLEGSYDMAAPRQKVWDAFLDPERLRDAIPGCERLEAVGSGEYEATIRVGVGGVKGTFGGTVRLFDLTPPDSYKMTVKGSGSAGLIHGETLISLSDAVAGTRVTYGADVQVGGLIASVGQRMMAGVAKMMADKFFARMAEILRAS